MGKRRGHRHSKTPGSQNSNSSPRRQPDPYPADATQGSSPTPHTSHPQHHEKAPKGKRPKPKLAPEPGRDLSAVLSYGPGFLPYTAAWTDSRTEQVRAFRRWTYVAINLIASEVASKHPNCSYLKTGDPEDYRAKRLIEPYERVFKSLDPTYLRSLTPATKLRHLEAYRHRLHEKALTPLLSSESLAPVEHNHPLRSILNDPNDPDTAWTLWYESIMYLLLTGNNYWWVPKNSAGRPLAIWVVPPHWMWPVVGRDRLIDGWEIRPVEGNYCRKFLPADEVIHFKHPNPVSKIDGYGALTAISQSIDVNESIDRSRVFAFRNGITPTVAVQFDGTLNDPSDEALRRIEAKFIVRQRGENRSNAPLFLPPGVKVVPLTLKPNEMVWGENSLETRNNILAGFRVPPGLVDAKGSGAAHKDEQVRFCSGALNPLVSFLGQVISEKFATLYDPSRALRVWWENFVPDDPTHLEATIKTDLLCGAITPNEVRIYRGRQPYPYPWADQPILPVNMAPLTTAQGGSHQDPDSLLGPSLPAQPTISDE